MADQVAVVVEVAVADQKEAVTVDAEVVAVVAAEMAKTRGRNQALSKSRVVHGDRIVVNYELDPNISYDSHWLRFSRSKSNFFQILPSSQVVTDVPHCLLGSKVRRW
jgi:hypothetical protein